MPQALEGWAGAFLASLLLDTSSKPSRLSAVAQPCPFLGRPFILEVQHLILPTLLRSLELSLSGLYAYTAQTKEKILQSLPFHIHCYLFQKGDKQSHIAERKKPSTKEFVDFLDAITPSRINRRCNIREAPFQVSFFPPTLENGNPRSLPLWKLNISFAEVRIQSQGSAFTDRSHLETITESEKTLWNQRWERA